MQSNAHLETLLIEIIRAGMSPNDATNNAAPPVFKSPDWEALLLLARKHGLSGLLYKSVQAVEPSDIPPPVLTVLRENYLNAHLLQRLAYEELSALLDAFARAEIPLIVLKGAALAKTLYADAVLRPFGDLDLLVHADDFERAADILRARDFQVTAEIKEGRDNALWGQQVFFRAGNHPAHVELHSQLFVLPYFRQRASLDWFWQHTATFSIFAREAKTFDAAANLLYLCAHRALHHGEPRLIWAYDIALLLAREEKNLDWAALLETAQTFGLAYALRFALDETVQVWQSELPKSVDEKLRAIRPGAYERVMFALARSGERQVRWGIALGNAQYRRAHLFPSRAYMRQHYPIQHDALLPFWYGARIASAGYHFARANVGLLSRQFRKRE